ncbi:VanZ family protein [Chloroherpeton thalassium ATCC 35110]|uniref:VanZ family protein n=1 Tax=Chloroherpeton thalassium (strain ATCC 35110 / GB-78) TaxID=517418 RepID=B3QX72_CHLT3|nr:VanZ family protein [Chloroherpeton thalassium]ACF14882.1 VanZ family protein [Chloroherpeton thalassium ATCC 35110]
MQLNKSFWLNQFPALLYAGFIFVLSSIPGDTFPVVKLDLISPDKLVHAMLFGGLAFLLAHALYHQESFPYLKENWLVCTILFATLYAISDETHQYFVRNRTPEIMDLNADLFGIVVFSLIFLKFRTKALSK